VSREAPDVRHLPSPPSVSFSWFAAAALVGWAGCGFSSGARGIDASVDTQGPDVPIDTPPGVTCYGPAGWLVCFNPVPSGDVTLPAMINTDMNTKAPCLTAPPMGWAAPQPAACFIVGDTITVPAGVTDVKGSKPLVLVANRLITVAGVLDASSTRGEPPTLPTECLAFSTNPDPPGASTVGGGGGAGGSFMTRGGNGGDGDNGSLNGQSGLADTVPPTHLRGGCPGQAGGAAAAADAGTVGRGGGVVYLISGGDIAIVGAINASGAGGRGSDKRAGGSGGGSGGMIVLYGATITVTPASPPAAVLMANGGGGGGGSTGGKASDGSDPSLLFSLASAPGASVNNGGDGGKGYPVATVNELDGTGGPSNGAGGGGGGAGAGYIRSNKPLTGATVSPAADIVP
jgi:hypothetical protein